MLRILIRLKIGLLERICECGVKPPGYISHRVNVTHFSTTTYSIYSQITSISVTSVANDKSDNEMVLGAVHISPGICLTAEENPRKSQLGPMKGLVDQSSPQMGSHSCK